MRTVRLALAGVSRNLEMLLTIENTILDVIAFLLYPRLGDLSL